MSEEKNKVKEIYEKKTMKLDYNKSFYNNCKS